MPGMSYMMYGQSLRVTRVDTLGDNEVVVHDASGMVRSLHTDTPVTVTLKKRK
jgi:hypothetical protein